MSTRYSRTADKALNEKHAAILKGLLQQPDNKYCADCKRKDPRWASWNLGIFVCIQCSGVHRSMGTHISKVKSVDLDTWVPDQVANMVKWGNARANMYWEANLKDKKPSESNIDLWIRAKYEQKRWARKGPIPDPSTLVVETEQGQQAAASPPPVTKSAQAQAPKPASEFANLDAFFASPSSTSDTTTTATTPKLQGADFFGLKSTPQTTSQSVPSSPPPASTPAQPKHEDVKSSILSLYSQPRAGSNSFQTNMGAYQQQLSGLSSGMPSGFVPQAPQTQAPAFQDVWGSFESAKPAMTSGLPQGSQFFNKPANSSSVPTQSKPTYDAFADLLN